MGAHLELFLWLGLEKDYRKEMVTEQFSEAELSTYGEIVSE